MERLKSSFDYTFHQLTQKRTLLLVVLTVATLSWVAVFANAKTDELQVHFFDVGQGDAIFLEFPDGRQMLVDGGPDDKVLERLGAAMPFWDRSIDIIVSTHADLDHSAGLVSVLGHYEVDTIIWNGIEATTKVFQDLKEAMESEGAKVIVGGQGTKVRISDVAYFEILNPVRETAPAETRNGQNHYSLVLRLVYGNDTFLFTGDIEREDEYRMIESGARLASEVLKIPHHGSKTSSSELFLKKVHPAIAVISAGRSNPYGHPHGAILQRLEEYGIKVRRTDLDGDVLIVSNGNSFQ